MKFSSMAAALISLTMQCKDSGRYYLQMRAGMKVGIETGFVSASFGILTRLTVLEILPGKIGR